MADPKHGIRVTIPSDVSYLEPIRTLIREIAALAGLHRDAASEVELAVTEGCANVIRHCYCNSDREPIDLTFAFAAGVFEVRIDDYGKFVDPSRIKSRPLDEVRPGGLGVHLMQKVMDEVTYTKNSWGGTSLTMRKRLARPGQEGPRKDRSGR
ncbi:MAG TPA: ATP-binding protein [Planctomycetota bacterium]|nr:ATP-binding protein [Planctomycetota bacterium]